MKLPILKSLRKVHASITHRCNLRCTYCSHFDSPTSQVQDIPTSHWVNFFEELGKIKVKHITLAGGEPFLRADILDVIKAIVHNNMRFSILSNGALITNEIAKLIAGSDQCNLVQISIDGPDSETHDPFRGKGSFAAAINAIKLLQEYGVKIDVQVTIHKNNFRKLQETARFLLFELDLPYFSTNAASHLGSCKNHPDDVQLNAKEYNIAMEELVAIYKLYEGRINATAGPLADVREWTRMEAGRQRDSEPFNNHGFLTACRCTFNSISVRPDGIMVPCLLLSHIELGKIGKDDINQVWLTSPELNRLRNRFRIPLSQFDYCRTCNYIRYCTGNCPALAYTEHNELNRPSSAGCLRLFLEKGGRLTETIISFQDQLQSF